MTGPNWDAFRKNVRETHTDAFDWQTVTVYNYTGGYDPATGQANDWTRDNGTAVDAEVVVPNQPDVITGPEGQQSEVRRRVRVRDDVESREDIDIVQVGVENERPTEIEVDGETYIVAEKMDEGNGLLALLCTEA